MFSEIIEHQEIIERLKRIYLSGRIPHCLMFAGISGIGKSLLALNFAKLLNCVQVADTDCCEQCPACVKMNKEHPDLHYVRPETQFIKIDQIRDLQSTLYLKPFEAKYKIYIIKEAEKLHFSAANALLKSLEEPPENTVFFLMTAHPEQLMFTILSRCQKFFCRPLSKEAIAAVIQKKYQKDAVTAQTIARLSEGSLTRAESVINDEFFAHRQELIGRFLKIKESDPLKKMEFCEEIVKDKEQFKRFIELLMLWFRDRIYAAYFRPKKPFEEIPFLNTDLQGLFETLAEDQKVSKLIEKMEGLFRIYRDLRRNVNPQLLAEQLIFEIASDRG